MEYQFKHNERPHFDHEELYGDEDIPSAKAVRDTIRRLLDNFEAGGNTVPYFRERAMLVIDEHSEVAGRRVFDQDNKGWKVVCNALKGRAIPDDDQYTLAVSLLATPSAENICHITLMELRDASDFFALHSGDYALGSIYGCAGPIR